MSDDEASGADHEDRRPSATSDDERSTALDLLRFQRASLLRKLDGLSDADAARALVPSGTSLLWLANHIADAHHIWLLHRFAGQRRPLAPHADTIDAATARAIDVFEAADAVVLANDPDAVAAEGAHGAAPANLRWVLGHLLEETARHAGHADILRELLDGSTGR